MITQYVHCNGTGAKSIQKASQWFSIRVESRQYVPGRSGCYTTAMLFRWGPSVRASAEKELLRDGGADPHFYLASQQLLAVGLDQLWAQSAKLLEKGMWSET